eukprot:TRINITY_DN983_c0_g1_i1.p1 TRINITY_DN983_c0_g1~~TRINITY_DN983_c0_g1_i1.p1  ORF type:complete len:734 (+),score=136.56 TRINITY_DN983_c0_g1_i1:141-2204(+)
MLLDGHVFATYHHGNMLLGKWLSSSSNSLRVVKSEEEMDPDSCLPFQIFSSRTHYPPCLDSLGTPVRRDQRAKEFVGIEETATGAPYRYDSIGSGNSVSNHKTVAQRKILGKIVKFQVPEDVKVSGHLPGNWSKPKIKLSFQDGRHYEMLSSLDGTVDFGCRVERACANSAAASKHSSRESFGAGSGSITLQLLHPAVQFELKKQSNELPPEHPVIRRMVTGIEIKLTMHVTSGEQYQARNIGGQAGIDVGLAEGRAHALLLGQATSSQKKGSICVRVECEHSNSVKLSQEDLMNKRVEEVVRIVQQRCQQAVVDPMSWDVLAVDANDPDANVDEIIKDIAGDRDWSEEVRRGLKSADYKGLRQEPYNLTASQASRLLAEMYGEVPGRPEPVTRLIVLLAGSGLGEEKLAELEDMGMTLVKAKSFPDVAWEELNFSEQQIMQIKTALEFDCSEHLRSSQSQESDDAGQGVLAEVAQRAKRNRRQAEERADEAEERAESLQNKCQSLEMKLEQSRLVTEPLQREIQEKSRQLQHVQSRLYQSEERAEILQNKCQSLEMELGESRSVAEPLQREIQEKSRQLQHVQSRLYQSEERAEILQNKCQSLEMELGESRSVAEPLQREIQEKSRQLQLVQSRLDQAEEQAERRYASLHKEYEKVHSTMRGHRVEWENSVVGAIGPPPVPPTFIQ